MRHRRSQAVLVNVSASSFVKPSLFFQSVFLSSNFPHLRDWPCFFLLTSLGHLSRGSTVACGVVRTMTMGVRSTVLRLLPSCAVRWTGCMALYPSAGRFKPPAVLELCDVKGCHPFDPFISFRPREALLQCAVLFAGYIHAFSQYVQNNPVWYHAVYTRIGSSTGHYTIVGDQLRCAYGHLLEVGLMTSRVSCRCDAIQAEERGVAGPGPSAGFCSVRCIHTTLNFVVLVFSCHSYSFPCSLCLVAPTLPPVTCPALIGCVGALHPELGCDWLAAPCRYLLALSSPASSGAWTFFIVAGSWSRCC